MWQLRKLSTNEPLSEAGPLPNNWGPIFGLHGFLDKIGDLSWIGPAYADQGWVELTEQDKKELIKANAMSRLAHEKAVAMKTLNDPLLTLGQKTAWENYVIALDAMCLCPDFDCDPKFPSKPSA